MAYSNLLKPDEPGTLLVEKVCTRLRRRQIVGSHNIALETAQLIYAIVRVVKFSTLDELLALLKLIGRRLNEANPKELASGNIVRRILRLFREEYRAAAATQITQPSTPLSGPETPGLHAPSSHYLSQDLSMTTTPPRTQNHSPNLGGTSTLPVPSRAPSLSNFVAFRHSRAQLERSGSTLSELTQAAASIENEEFMRQSAKLKPIFIQAIEEVIGELETTHDDVAKGAREHIHSAEVIMTLGHSKTVETFIKHAYRDRKFTVIVVESAPSYLGHTMAKSLSASNIPTILIPDSSVHALMPRVTKVVLGAHSILANGGLFALSGTLSACLAAKAFSKPVVVTTGQFKFAPVWNLYHEHGAVDFQSPGNVLGYEGDGSAGGITGVTTNAPYYEYIRPELINLFVTNEGDHSPSYIYRIIKEAYDEEDVEL
ncbi:putative eukaryotic translation initiation factor 2B subunit 2 [Kockovaella imperatae]|uniref:Translation initiation factor eIF2B subunit beta n=1 Tax=Kockovaella imperatae TaxID=4999 RepID=A0A1Y1UHP8_9TREE|nr:putative eukaryotic translation initiation factor 2B subunit 2 [Kockovaella imperatae]ORX37593.1 putative eukaryotic translation initiation factor 2B subunit 2 [Kockovaella imperatae]